MIPEPCKMDREIWQSVFFGQQPGEQSRQLILRAHTEEVQDHCLSTSMLIQQRIFEQGEKYLLHGISFPNSAKHIKFYT